MFKRGWAQKEIVDLVNNPVKTSDVYADGRPLVNLATGNPAKAFIRADGQGVLQDLVTGEVFHVSDKLDPTFIFYWAWPQ